MKIGINAFFLKYPTSGMGQYLIHLLDTFTKIDQHNEYAVLKPPTAVQNGQLHRRNQALEQVLWEQFTCPSVAHTSRADVYHAPYFAAPLFPRTPTVITIADVLYLRLPLYLESARKKAYLRLNMLADDKAKLIITVSQHSKQDIVDTLKIPPERIRVTYLAAGDECHPITDPEKIAAVRARYGLSERYILYIGGLDYRKNVPQLVRAFAQLCHRLRDPHLQLFIAGDPDKQVGPNALFPDPRPIAAELGVANQILYRFVQEQDKAALYSGAQAFVFLSLYEGFGLTPLEAMNCGTPVNCSNRSSLPEVVGDAALSLDPDNTQDVVDAMHSVLTNSTLRADLHQRSLQRANQFSWQKTAMETIAVYEEAFAASKK